MPDRNLRTFLAEHFLFSPRLSISSPTKGCGKTTLLDVLSRLVLRPLLAPNVTPAAVFRVIERDNSCLLIDEADKFQFEDAFERHLTPEGPSKVHRCPERDEIRTSRIFEPHSQKDGYALGKCENVTTTGFRAPVPLRTVENGQHTQMIAREALFNQASRRTVWTVSFPIWSIFQPLGNARAHAETA